MRSNERDDGTGRGRHLRDGVRTQETYHKEIEESNIMRGSSIKRRRENGKGRNHKGEDSRTRE
jgi:hypothetical protein